jgi:alkanesulfonate monooxygenase SsuD/methylene tetrahydromethanopterin reductase-like flavin-dependent oxidoreductase (luciferase family)
MAWQIGVWNRLSDTYLREIDRRFAPVVERVEFTYEHVKPDRFIVGSPEDCIRQIEALQHETGVNHLVLRFRHPMGPSHAQVCQAIQRFGEQVIPHVV